MDIIALLTAITGLVTTVGNIILFAKNSHSIDELTDKLGNALEAINNTASMLNDRFADVLRLFNRLV